MDETFEKWMKKVDLILEINVGMSHLDLPDWCWHDDYDDFFTPKQACIRAIRNAQDY